jgi:hypothetical protein
MSVDPVHGLERVAKPKRTNRDLEANSETKVLHSRIDTLDGGDRKDEDNVILQPVKKSQSMPMLKTRRQKGLLHFLRSIFR